VGTVGEPECPVAQVLELGRRLRYLGAFPIELRAPDPDATKLDHRPRGAHRRVLCGLAQLDSVDGDPVLVTLGIALRRRGASLARLALRCRSLRVGCSRSRQQLTDAGVD